MVHQQQKFSTQWLIRQTQDQTKRPNRLEPQNPSPLQRPRRTIRPHRRYEPETGKWITD